MFTRWGDLVYRFRYAVLGITVAGLLALGGYGFGVENHLSSSGWFDPNAESSQASQLADSTFGRDHKGDVIVMYTTPPGTTFDTAPPEWNQKITDSLNALPKDHPQISGIYASPFRLDDPKAQTVRTGLISQDGTVAFAAVMIAGENDTEGVNNFRAVKDDFTVPGIKTEVAGMQAVSGTLNDTIASDQKRMEMLAIPAVAVLLFFIFGGVVAALLPLITGVLTVLASNGIIRIFTNFTEVNSFVGAVVSMIGLGLAIDYGLFIVSRFREEMAEGYPPGLAVKRSIMTAGRTVTFSAIMIVAGSTAMLIFPQGFLKSVAYGTMSTVALAALTSLTVLPCILAMLGPRVDMLSLKFIRKTKTADEIENSYWGRSTAWVMKHPLKIAIPICILLLLLIIPVQHLKFGGISESYLPPDNPTRVAQEKFDRLFPGKRSDTVKLVIVTDNSKEIGGLLRKADAAPGLQAKFTSGTVTPPPKGSNVYTIETPLADGDHDETIAYLRSIDTPGDVKLMVTGQAALMKDSMDALTGLMPLMIALAVIISAVLMFLSFGSVVLPLKAALMSALGLGSTLGILTWIFIDGHGASILNFTPQPIMAPVLVLIMSVIFGLSTDYEVFLLSRMVEARTQGASTTEAVRSGTAQTGRIITAAALILLVVVGAFAFSDLVMMQYIAYGMMAALFIDATVLRMLLVPATMKLLGDDCWWAPHWMKVVQSRVGLAEPVLTDERPGRGEVVDLVKATPVTDPVTMIMPVLKDGTPAKPARKLKRRGFRGSEAPTVGFGAIPKPTPPAPQPVTPFQPPAVEPESSAGFPPLSSPDSSTGYPQSPADPPEGPIGYPSAPGNSTESSAGYAPLGTSPGTADGYAPPLGGSPGNADGYGPSQGNSPETGGGYPQSPGNRPEAADDYPQARGNSPETATGYALPHRNSSDANGGYALPHRNSSDANGGYALPHRNSPEATGGYPQSSGNSPEAAGGYPPVPGNSPETGSGYSQAPDNAPGASAGYSLQQGNSPEAPGGYLQSPGNAPEAGTGHALPHGNSTESAGGVRPVSSGNAPEAVDGYAQSAGNASEAFSGYPLPQRNSTETAAGYPQAPGTSSDAFAEYPQAPGNPSESFTGYPQSPTNPPEVSGGYPLAYSAPESSDGYPPAQPESAGGYPPVFSAPEASGGYPSAQPESAGGYPSAFSAPKSSTGYPPAQPESAGHPLSPNLSGSPTGYPPPTVRAGDAQAGYPSPAGSPEVSTGYPPLRSAGDLAAPIAPIPPIPFDEPPSEPLPRPAQRTAATSRILPPGVPIPTEARADANAAHTVPVPQVPNELTPPTPTISTPASGPTGPVAVPTALDLTPPAGATLRPVPLKTAKVAPHPAERAQALHPHEADTVAAQAVPQSEPTVAPAPTVSFPSSAATPTAPEPPVQQAPSMPQAPSVLPMRRPQPDQQAQQTPQEQQEQQAQEQPPMEQAPQPQPEPETPDAPAEPEPGHPEETGTADPGRSSIERWMADLRNARRRTDSAGEPGRHSGNSNRTVSVNEILRRQNRD
ncbi:MMPL family transporter [Nocardia stercoris]|uniref:MMPL family transporter n=1 Tax=Nocardia stercoris TaxID=2483361 RepID=UPI0018F7161F|nr:MMPL family transporter [Nocardia stercoris]